MMLNYDKYLEIVNDCIAAIPYPKEPNNLYEPISYTMAVGGKRIRPVMVLMACDALGGDRGNALNPAIGLELFHNFTLLHDDVMDNAAMRRGKPTVHRRWNDNVAILSGDAMLTLASQYMTRVDDEKRLAVTELFNKTAMEIYEGQQYDMDFEHLVNVTVDNYIEMIRLKTSVLLGCACQLGAILADASPEDALNLYAMGVNLGLAFQLRDDMLDVWGDEATFGKEIGGDIMNNKKTFLLVNAKQLATGDNANELRHWLNDEYALRREKVMAVTALYERLGLREIAENTIDNYTRKALSFLEKVGMNDEGKVAFTSLCKKLVGRNK